MASYRALRTGFERAKPCYRNRKNGLSLSEEIATVTTVASKPQEPDMNKTSSNHLLEVSVLFRKIQRLLPVATLFVLTCESSHAASYTWNGTGNGNTSNGW